MKFLHTSDLHIGKRLLGISLAEDQIYILRQIIKTAKDENADAILVSGDIYDNSNPSAEAVSIFEKFLISASSNNIKIYISCGNHDSETRLGFGQSFFENAGIFISKPFDGSIQRYQLEDEYGRLNIYLLPYLKPAAAVSKIFGKELKTYQDVVKKAVEQLNIDKKERNIILAHQFVVSGDIDPETCESENIIGGIERVSSEIFADFDYVALGHIHKPQSMGSRYIRYSGTPLKYSVSEKNHKKSVCILEMKEKGNVSVNNVRLSPLRDLREITGSFNDIYNKKIGFDEGNPDDYIFISLTDNKIISGVKPALAAIYGNIVNISYKNSFTADFNIDVLNDEKIKFSDIDLFKNFFAQRTGHEMSRMQEDIISEIINGDEEYET